MTAGPRLAVQALLLGEKLDLRGFPRVAGSGAESVVLLGGDPHPAIAFRWGAVVLFEPSAATRAAVLRQLEGRIANPLPVPLQETAWMHHGAERDDVDELGEIHLIDLDVPRLTVLADALAKSAALSQQEQEVARTLDGIDPVVTALRRRGRLSFFSRGLMRAVGEALAARSRSTLRVQAADSPDLLWDHAGLIGLHRKLSEEFELAERCDALERKLVMVGEIMQTLLSLIQGQRSLTLEVAVAAFILIEVIATLYGLVAG